jgi:hypothetical protein
MKFVTAIRPFFLKDSFMKSHNSHRSHPASPEVGKDAHPYPRTPDLHLVRSANPKVSLTVVVAGADVFRVRQAILRSGSGAIDIIKVTQIPGSLRIRLSVSMEPFALHRTMFAILNSVEAAEFGRVTSST